MKKTYTVTMTVNLHVDAVSEQAALEVARETLPSSFDVIEDEVKLSADQDPENS
jgi:hypothetical protein